MFDCDDTLLIKSELDYLFEDDFNCLFGKENSTVTINEQNALNFLVVYEIRNYKESLFEFFYRIGKKLNRPPIRVIVGALDGD